MKNIYCMSDIHGDLGAFEYALSLFDLGDDDKLILLGDYIHGANSYSVLDKITALQEQYGDRMIVLAGNHEDMAVDGTMRISATGYFDYGEAYNEEKEERYTNWMSHLPRYHVEEEAHIIFVHAGIDEEAEDTWQWGTDEYTFTEKFPATVGKFYEDWIIVAGHVGTATIAGDRNFHDIYFDGESHYYIDGTVLDSGVIPVLKIDMETKRYYQLTESGAVPICPYEWEIS